MSRFFQFTDSRSFNGKSPLLILLVPASLLLLACEPVADKAPSPASEITAESTDVDIVSFPPGSQARARLLLDTVNRDPDDANKNGLMAMYAHAHGQSDVAVNFYSRAAERAPTVLEWPYLRGVLLSGQGANTTAIESLRQAYTLNPQYPPLRLRLAQLLIKENQAGEALKLLDNLVREHPNYPEARWTLGQFKLEQGDYAAAIAELNFAVAKVPHYGSAHYALAAAWQATNNPDKAAAHRKLFEKHKNAGPVSQDQVLSRVEDLRNSSQQAVARAARFSAAGKFNEAIEVFQEILKNDPDNAVAHINLIGLYGETGQIDQAQSHYESGRKVAPDAVKLHNNYGVLLLRQKRYAEAVDIFRRAIDVDASYATPYKYLGLSLQNLDQHDEALANFKLAFDKDPLDDQAGYLLGNALLREKHTDQAIAVYQAITTVQNPKTPSYLRALAQAHLSTGDSASALVALERARLIAYGYGQSGMVKNIDADMAKLTQAGSAAP